MNSLFKNHGFGLGLRPEHVERFKTSPPPSIEWLEALTENYLPWQKCPLPLPRQNLRKIRANRPIALHGVSLSLGSTDPLDKAYLGSLKELARDIEPIWISDHLAWCSHSGEHFHNLLPLPYTEEAITHVTDRIKTVQDFLGRRILLENLSSYVEFESSEMQEWEFLSEIVRRADCGMLLDLNNVYVSAVNHGFDPLTYLRSVPRERIGQIHLAGHSIEDGYLFDTHNTHVCDEVWALYRWVAKNFGAITTMVEWDSEIPELAVLEEEIGKARKIHESLNQSSNYSGNQPLNETEKNEAHAQRNTSSL